MEFLHRMGIEKDELMREFERIIERIGFTIIHSDVDTIIALNERGERLKLQFKSGEKGLLSLPRTDVIIECNREVHEMIQKRILMLRGGG